jgi:putative solute:sodium symporter small subunit
MTEVRRRQFWSRTLKLTAVLLALWLAVCVMAPWFARDLDAVRGFGFPLGYWLAAQGLLLCFLALIVVYVWAMDRLEARYLDGGEDATGGPGAGSA